MVDRKTVFEIHRLKNEGCSDRKIASLLGINRKTVRKYVFNPDPAISKKNTKPGKLGPYYKLIDEFPEKDPGVSAVVILQRLQEHNFDGKISTVRNYLRKKRDNYKKQKAFIRFESSPGEQFQTDWGHFGSLPYGNTKRKLYALAVTECYSRMLFVTFTHSRKQAVLHQALTDAFKFFCGTPQKIVVDNMLTAVHERSGRIISYNGAFLDFLRPFKTVPHACNVRSPWEKGKVENAIGYIRKNFWPLRTFSNLEDVIRQKDLWLDTVANVRIHETTNEVPAERFKKVSLSPLPEFLSDCRETADTKVYKDFCVKFDCNTYTTPPWAVGKRVTVKADQKKVSIYLREKLIATHFRSWERKKRIELPSHSEQVKKLEKKLWQDRDIALFASLGREASDYLQSLSKAQQPIRKNVTGLLTLKDEYGTSSLIYAIKKATEFKAYGADYIENILYQEMTPEKKHSPVRLNNEALNRIRLSEPSLEDYDRYVTERNKDEDE